MTEREYYRRFDNLSKKEVNKKNSKEAYVRNDVMKTAIKHRRGEKKRGIRTIDGFRKKLMIPDSEIPKCPEFEVKLKIGKILKKQNPLEEYSVRIYEIDLYFYEHYEKKKNKLIKMNVNTYYLELMCILMNFCQQQKLMKKDILTGTLLLRKKKKKEALEKKLGCKFFRINTSNAKNTYDLDYEVSDIEAFLDKFNKKKMKELEDKIKEKEEESNKKIKGLEAKNKNSTTNQITNNFGKIIIKN